MALGELRFPKSRKNCRSTASEKKKSLGKLCRLGEGTEMHRRPGPFFGWVILQPQRLRDQEAIEVPDDAVHGLRAERCGQGSVADWLRTGPRQAGAASGDSGGPKPNRPPGACAKALEARPSRCSPRAEM